MWNKIVGGLGLIGVLTSGVACGSAAEDEGSTNGGDAFTVAGGDRFIVSATPTKIVLRKSVDGTPFPFTETSLAGKAILIHPVAGRAATGVYARARTIASEADRYVITAEPLSLAEMENIAEDDIVRIYMSTNHGRIAPASMPLTLSPLTEDSGKGGTPPVAGFDRNIFQGLGRPKSIFPGAAFSQKITAGSFTPEVLVDYTKASGLELGMRASLDWTSRVTLTGTVSGEFFRSPSISTPSYIVLIPIGPAVVPVSFSAAAFVTCSASVQGPFSLEADVDVHAGFGGSMAVKPSASMPSIKHGRWEPQAAGTASVKDVGVKVSGATVTSSIACALPRVELRALVAGVAGPYIAIQPTISATPDELAFQASVAAGVEATLFKSTNGVEVILKTWKPASVQRP